MTPNDGPGAAPADPDQRDQRDQSEPTNETGSTRPGDPPPPGSVAAEAALLVELLSRRSWSSTSGMPSGSSRGERAGSAAHDHDAGHTTGPGTAGRPDGPAGECTCGGTTPAACRVCPVCQLIAFVQQVNPDTIEKVADFVGFAATALRDLATAQRERRAEPDTTGTDTSETHPAETHIDETGPGGSA